MGAPAAKQGDRIQAVDTHLVLDSSGVLLPPVQLPFGGQLANDLSTRVKIDGKPAAVVGSAAENEPHHLPPPKTTFQTAPSNLGKVTAGSARVRIEGRAAARAGDPAETCTDAPPAVPGLVVATGRKVRFG